MTRIGIVAALDAEADSFLPGAGEIVESPYPARLVDFHGRKIAIVTSGIGKVNAAVAATALILRYNVDLLFVVGTAGSLSPGVHGCFEIVESVQHDYGAARPGQFGHYRAGDWPIGDAILRPFAALPLPACSLPKARILTGDAFVECPDQAARLASHLAGDLVDMETAAVAQVAARFALPWAAIKATTDTADGGSATDFTANLARASRRAAAAAEDAIAAL